MLNIIIVLAAVNFVELACIGLCIALLRESYLKIKDASALLPVNLNTTRFDENDADPEDFSEELLLVNWPKEDNGNVSRGMLDDDAVISQRIMANNFEIFNLKER